MYRVKSSAAIDSAAREDSELSRHLLRAQEEERKRISRELHDETGQGLMLRLQLGVLATELQTRDSQEKIKEATDLLDRTIAGLRRIIGRLFPRALEELGLSGAIRQEARQLSKNTGLTIRVSIPDDLSSMDSEVGVAAYRCVQEALNNVAKHAQAHNVTIELHDEGNKLALKIEDDGIGISKAMQTHSKGFGLVGMRERVAVLGGTIRIGRSSNRGTRLRIAFPVSSRLATLPKSGVERIVLRHRTMRRAG